MIANEPGRARLIDPVIVDDDPVACEHGTPVDEACDACGEDAADAFPWDDHTSGGEGGLE